MNRGWKRKPNNPLTRASCQSTRRPMTISNHTTCRGKFGRVSVGRRVPPEPPFFVKSPLMGRSWACGGRGVPTGPIGPTGAPLFTCPSDQNKCRGCHPSVYPFSSNKQTNKRGTWYNMVESLEGGAKGWSQLLLHWLYSYLDAHFTKN